MGCESRILVEKDRVKNPVLRLGAIYLAMVLISIVSQSAHAQTVRGSSLRHGRTDFWIETHALLDPVTSFDFQESVRQHPTDSRSPAPTILNHAGKLTAHFEIPPTGTPLTTIRREIFQLWRLQVQNGDSVQFTRISYDVIGVNGRKGVFSHLENDASIIAVRVIELPLKINDRGHGVKIIEGGIVLEMDLGHVVKTGKHSGSLRVTLTQI